jgi:hypothetical protein
MDEGDVELNIGPKYRVFQKKLCSGIPNVTVWWVLQKRLYLKAYKLSIVHGVEWWIVCTPLSVNVFVTPHSNFWNTIVKLFLKHPIITNERHIEL